MTVTREDLNPCTVKLTVELDPQEVDGAFAKALKRAGKEVRIPGFRPGHAPTAMVEKMIDPNRLYEEAADGLVRTTLPKAVEQESLQPDPGTRPSVALESLDREAKSAKYTAKVPLPPKIELGEYKGVAVERPSADVSDEEIQFQIDELRKRKGEREVVTDRGLQEGDVAVLNMKAEGADGEGKSFMTVVGQTFPALDEAITGMSTEEMKSVELTFPEEFSDKAFAGTTQKVQLAVNSASTVKLADLNDEFAQDFQAENVDQLKERMRESIAQAKANLGREMMQETILETLREKSTIHVSDNMWETLAGQRLSEIQQEQSQEGKTIEQYAEENGMTLDELVEKWNEQAKIHVERAMIVREIFEREGLQLTNADLNTELFFMASEYSVQPQELLQQLQGNNALPELQFRAISRKVTDLLLASAAVAGEDAKAAANSSDAVEGPGPSEEKAIESGAQAMPEDDPNGSEGGAGEAVGSQGGAGKPKRAQAKKPSDGAPSEDGGEIKEATPTDAGMAPEEAGSAGPVAVADDTSSPESEGDAGA